MRAAEVRPEVVQEEEASVEGAGMAVAEAAIDELN
jgi:hypothetical protein